MINNHQPSSPPDAWPPRHDRGCLVGCLIGTVVLLLAAGGLVWLLLALFRALGGSS
jgi:hypothetical protein